ncbi:MAG: metal transporter [Salibacteraceae bacterium]
MKSITSLTTILVMAVSFNLTAQKEVIEDTLLVKGICGMCKERIEEAAYGKGVKFVNWDKVTDQLTLAYRSDKTSIAEIEDRILKAGHSTENRETDPKDYEKLPDCCRYHEVGKH